MVAGLLPATVLAVATEAAAEPAATETGESDPTVPEASAEALALAEARESGESVEVESLRGETSEVFATPEGDLEALEYLRPVWARVAGEWQPVDTELVLRDDGSVGPRAATAQLTFSGGGAGPLVELERGGRALALSWSGELPAPELSGDTAVYHDVLPDVDLRLAAQADGFSQLIVVNSAEAAADPALEELRLRLRATNVVVEVTEEGGVQALDANADTPVFEAPVPLMWDSSSGGGDTEGRVEADEDEAAAVGPPGAGESSNLGHVGAEVDNVEETLTLTPDEEVLRGEETVYPVYIDPQWHSPRSSAWTMVSRYWAGSPQWKFNGDSNAGMGYCGWATCMPQDVKRLMYRLPTSKFAGTRITSAEFVVRNVHSASCTPQNVELWRTRGISANTTWNSQNNSSFWAERMRTESFSYGYQGCAAADAEFDVRSAVQSAADNGTASLTFGLRAANESERLTWKRFSDRAHLRVLYNRVPPRIKPSQLVMEYGGACKPADRAADVRTLGQIHANNVTDPDGDQVAVEFAARWDSGDGQGNAVRWESGLSTAKRSGSAFSARLPGSVPSDVPVQWLARSYDGSAYSPWSSSGGGHACHFVHNVSVPQGPAVSSPFYPASDPSDPSDPWHRGTGHYGEFTLDAVDDDVDRYWYGLNGDPLPQNEVATTDGGPRIVDLVPERPGLHFVTAQAVDRAGNISEITSYQFRVQAGGPPRASWPLDDATGAEEAAGAVPDRWATVHGGATLGGEGAVGTALELDGDTGYLSTDGPILDTNRAFSVSAWVKLDRKPTSAAVIATQAGTHRPGFELYYSAAQDSWAFNQYRADAPDDNRTARVLAADVEVVAGEWTHLVGSYDPGGGQLRLFVNGELAGATAYSAAWNARGPVQIGAGRSDDQIRSPFPGAIDEVQIFDLYMASPTSHVARLFNKERLHTSGRPAVALLALDEAAGERRVSAGSDVLGAATRGGVEFGVPGVHGQAVRFDGTSGFGATGTAMVNTGRNFAVSAWARLDRLPDGDAVVATQTGTEKPGFELYYSGAHGRWGFNQYSDNAADATPVAVLQPDGESATAEEWVHLVGVHDSYEGTLTLYVNGEPAGSVPWETPFHANQRVQIGAGQQGGTVGSFFPGAIDDVRLFDRVLTAYEAWQLYHQAPIVRARWQLDQLEAGDAVSSPDATPFGNDLFLWGGAGVSPGFVDDASLYVDGGGGYAYVPEVPIDTSLSFTVSGFARAASPPRGAASVLSAVGQRESAFAVRWVPDGEQEGFGRWEVSLADRDQAGAVQTRVSHQRLYDVRDWRHLALVYDGFAAEARLYVDGELEELTCSDDAAESCVPGESWAPNVFPFEAGSTLHVGRSLSGGVWREAWPGAIDDVWAVQGALAPEQIRELSLGRRDAPSVVPPLAAPEE
ncbi:Concanavalin A-like lectin/glucanases superfamily protein [Streptomyces zhaozhouensis]|uniref:Concanavalin A-like lectin/glucanases superfamily protein n=1 Tax=Streptomyces zhaozhouensis TaxID=1300267 RepID=A0A286DND8_9ACTN|nr:LamG-like jellyroll fold domain-containing protein [Streptomyces zhaozhouensis]SOD60139.1 Concanavalin A-like lectin/glucanases superfamily protein [Streptomyces zhaozhouensis]